jgi:parallel beta-helix repeat protein
VISLQKITLAMFAITSLLLCLLYVSALGGSEISAKASPSTLVVDGNATGAFKTIQQAVNHADSGDIIRVHNGTYYEQVFINKSISLFGSGANSTIIDGNRTGDVVSILADDVIMEGFTVRRSQIYPSYAGIRVEGSSRVLIRQDKVVNSYRGIAFYSSSNDSVVDCVVSNNSVDGLGFFSSRSNVVSGNVVSYNFVNGIAFYSSDNNTLLSNTVLYNSIDGITFSSCNNNLISGNIISFNSNDGITLSSCSDNKISGNTLSSNSLRGLTLFLSGNNLIYHNNFRNAYQVSADSTSVSKWNYEREGNYWSDYRGRNLNGTGIGDIPYEIDQNNKDEYPLMGIFSVFSASFKGKTYEIAAICNSTISNFIFEIGPETGNKIIQFDVTSKPSIAGFCRISILTELMDNSSIVMVGQEEILPHLLPVSNETLVCLYFTYLDGTHTIRIISSEAMRSYGELLARYIQLQDSLHGVNTSYNVLLDNYTLLLSNYGKLQETYRALNTSYQGHLLDYSESAQNLRDLTYIFAFATGVLIISVIYLSRRTHVTMPKETKTLDEKR